MLALLAMLISAVALAFIPVLVRQLLDNAFFRKDQSLVQATLWLLIAVYSVCVIADYLGHRAAGKTGDKISAELYADFFNTLLSLPASAYASLHGNNQIEMLVLNIHQISQITIQRIVGLVQDCLIIISLLACMLYFNRELPPLLIFTALLMMLIVEMMRDYLKKSNQHSVSALSKLIQQLLQTIAHYRIIRLDGGQTCEVERLSKTSQSAYDMKTRQILSVITIAGRMTIALMLCAVGYIAALQAMNDSLGFTDAGALIAAMMLLTLPIKRLAHTPKLLARDRKILESIFAFLDQPRMQLDSGRAGLSRLSGELVFEEVILRRTPSDKLDPERLNLTIRPGEVVVFKGFDTGKKYALIDWLLGMESPPSNGKIYADGFPLHEIQRNDLYASIALLSANPISLDDRIAGNIAYGALRCTDEARITAAARDSGAMKFIRRLPGGLQTRIDQAETQLSRQQLQLLAIARAWVKNPSILILDEIPENHCPDSEAVTSALEKLMENRTTLIFHSQIPHLKKIDHIDTGH